MKLTPWGEAEFLAWWLNDRALPPLVTTSSSQASLGVPGRPDTTVLYGGAVDGEIRTGGRFTAGLQGTVTDACGNAVHHCGVEVVYFFLCEQDHTFQASSAGAPVLARPFVNILTGEQFSEQVANLQVGTIPPGPGPRPGFARAFTGSIAIDNPSRVYGGELNATWVLGDGEVDPDLAWAHALVGFRHFGLAEDLRIREDLTLPATVDSTLVPARIVLPETNISLLDEFQTRNYFYGPQLGIKSGFRAGPLTARMVVKLALGWMDQQVRVQGSNTNTVRDVATGQFLPPVTAPGGLLAQSTNSGDHQRMRFAFLPETTIDVGYELRPGSRLFVGYNLLYASSVVRPGDAIDLSVDPRFRAGGTAPADATRPAFAFRTSDLWLHGLTAGFDFRY